MLKGHLLAHGRLLGAACLLGMALAVAAPGDLDPEFGDGGLLSLKFSEFGHSATAVAQQSDGKLLIVGLGDVILENDDDFIVARLEPDGALDAGFGVAGAAVADFAKYFDVPYAVLQQPDGKIVLAGTVGVSDSAYDLGLVRFNTDGTLDAAFGNGGWATIDLGGDDEAAYCLVLQPGGELVAAGYTNASGMYRPAFVRVTDTGVLDTAFGTAGITLLDFSTESSYANDCAQQSSGKLVSVGRVVSSTGETSIGFARLTADGMPDPSFGAAGLVTLPIEADFEDALSVVIQPDDSIVTSGFEFMPGADHGNAVLRRLHPDGVPDATFGSGGKSVVDFGSESIFYELVAQTDGTIVTTGYRLTGEFFPDLILARLDAAGQLDTGFGIDGVAVADFGAGGAPPYGVGYGLVRQADNNYVVVGNNFNTGSMIVARFDDFAAVPGRVGFTNTFRSAQESDGSVSYTVRRTGGRSGAISVDYATAAGEAEPGADFVTLFGTLSWSDGETDEKTLTIDLIDDSNSERSEGFALKLTDPTGGAILAASEATTQITSTDGPGELRFLYQLFGSAVIGTEGDLGLTVPVVRVFGSEGAISVSYTVLGGGTATEGGDFVMSGTLSWADGDSDSKSITIDYLEDTLVEGTETFRIALNSPTGGVTLHNSYRFQDCVIRDNNRGFGFSTPSVSVSEQDASVAVTIVASDPQGAAASVEYSTASGSATSDADFTSTSGTLTWVAGDPDRKTIAIPISDDAQDEPDETFTVTLANPTEGFALGTAVITVTVVDNDIAGGGGGGGSGSGGSGSGGGALAWLEFLGLAALAWLGRIRKSGGKAMGNERKKGRMRDSLFVGCALLAAGAASAAPGGELDPTFRGNGRTTIAFPGGSVGSAGVQQPDGKLLIAGSNQPTGTQYDLAVLRLSADGTLDATFGESGIATVDFGFGNDDAYVMFLQPNGKIVAAGASEVGEGAFDMALARLNADGSVDSTFGLDGQVRLDLGGNDDLASGAVRTQDGRIVIAGWSNANGDYDVAFARFNGDGSLDTTFGINGAVLVDTGTNVDNVAFFLTQQADGKLIACGMAGPEPFEAVNASMHAVRVHADGTVDATFGIGGIVNVDPGTEFGLASTCKALPDGTTILAGGSGTPGSEDLALARLTSGGILDASFGTGGLSSADLGGAEVVHALLLLSDGKLGVTGFTADSSNGAPQDLYIARFNADGSLDTTFGNSGATIADFGSGDRSADAEGLALIEQADSKLVAVGVVGIEEAFAMARVEAAGAGSIGVAGFVRTSASVTEGIANVVLTVRRTGGSLGAINVDVEFADITTQSPGDHRGVNTTLSWSDGDMMDRTITIPITNDSTNEGVERFLVTLSNDSTAGLALAATEAVVTITDNDSTARGSGGGSTDVLLLGLLLLGRSGLRHACSRRNVASILPGQPPRSARGSAPGRARALF